MTQTNAELIIDLMSAVTLDVHFAQFPERYRVRYDLSGFARAAMNTMPQCRTSGFTEDDVLEYLSDKTSVAEIAND